MRHKVALDATSRAGYRSSMTSEPALMTTSEVAKALRVNPATVRRWAEAGDIPSTTLPGGGYRRFRREDIEAIAAGRALAPAADQSAAEVVS